MCFVVNGFWLRIDLCRVSLEFMMVMEVGKLRNLWLRICINMLLR